jgi:beta-lactamase class A
MVVGLAAVLLLPGALRAEQPWPMALQSALTEEARGFDGEIAMYVEELKTGARYTHNAATPTYLASGVKILVMIAVFEELRAGRLRWEEQIVLDEDDVCDGAPKLKRAEPGDRFTVEQLVYWMMQHSDNLATDLLIKRVGLAKVNRAARRYGGERFGELTTMLGVRRAIYRRLDARADQLSARQLAGLRRARALSGRVRQFSKIIGLKRPISLVELEVAYEDYYASGLNSAAMVDVGHLLARLERREVIDPLASQQMLEIMLGCRTGARRLRAGLPAEALLAHKTGTQHRRMCDLGIVYPLERRPYVIAICLKDFASLREAELLTARLAAKTHALLVDGRGWPPPPP